MKTVIRGVKNEAINIEANLKSIPKLKSIDFEILHTALCDKNDADSRAVFVLVKNRALVELFCEIINQSRPEWNVDSAIANTPFRPIVIAGQSFNFGVTNGAHTVASKKVTNDGVAGTIEDDSDFIAFSTGKPEITNISLNEGVSVDIKTAEGSNLSKYLSQKLREQDSQSRLDKQKAVKQKITPNSKENDSISSEANSPGTPTKSKPKSKSKKEFKKQTARPNLDDVKTLEKIPSKIQNPENNHSAFKPKRTGTPAFRGGRGKGRGRGGAFSTPANPVAKQPMSAS